MNDLSEAHGLCKPSRQEFFSTTQDRVSQPKLPHNIELEQALLGSLLISNEGFERVADILRPEHFHEPIHGRIYATIANLIEAGKVANPLTVKTFFETAEPVSLVMTVPQYLGKLAVSATSTLYVADYAKAIFDLATRRTLIDLGHTLVAEASDMDVDDDPAEAITRAEQALYNVAQCGQQPDSVAFKDVLEDVVTASLKAYEEGGRPLGIPTEFADLDKALGGGLSPGDLIIIAGRPSMGKTALAVNIGWHIASRRRKALGAEKHGEKPDRRGGIVDFFSLEMTKEQVAGRILSGEVDVSLTNIRAGLYQSQMQAEKVAATRHRIASTPFHIDDTGGISLARLATRARRLKRRRGMDVLIIDYLQIMSGAAKAQSQGRVQEIGQITAGLKALAKELHVPIILLSQLSRGVENREDKRPQLSDLRESGSIEQDADVVLFVYREEYYVERKKPEFGSADFDEWQKKLQAVQGKAEALISKNRQGRVCTVELAFHGQTTRFSNLAVESGGQSR